MKKEVIDIESAREYLYVLSKKKFKDSNYANYIMHILDGGLAFELAKVFQGMEKENTGYDIPNEGGEGVNKFSPLFFTGIDAQLKQMKKYDREKKGFENIGLFFAARRISHYMPELLEFAALEKTKYNLNGLIEVASHVANYCHMIIYKCNKVLRKLK